jgi:hypothetical protein
MLKGLDPLPGATFCTYRARWERHQTGASTCRPVRRRGQVKEPKTPFFSVPTSLEAGYAGPSVNPRGGLDVTIIADEKVPRVLVRLGLSR